MAARKAMEVQMTCAPEPFALSTSGPSADPHPEQQAAGTEAVGSTYVRGWDGKRIVGLLVERGATWGWGREVTGGGRGDGGRRAPRWLWSVNSPGVVIAGLWGPSILHQSAASVPANAVDASLQTLGSPSAVLGSLGLSWGSVSTGLLLFPRPFCFMAMRPTLPTARK
ncbi:hypothetical protein B0J13DRAFT_524329 [Dactylonectria estremocensis]|uniref:Uncharacterized protein n=1 Tax=Dactylonectria estremocensis TaxID=1079267 RepID=A0A9P9J9W3_9HYPO|nr:hypothetical protein B0J13DRAFT_524329 [Dactylonectria estremocensis]